MPTQQQRITELAQAIASDIKELKASQGLLSNLSTANKTSLIEAINELKTSIANTTDINDASTSASATWSSDKINTSINNAVSALVNGSGSALDTLKELADALGNDANFAATLAEQMGKRVRVDESQMFSANERLMACINIGIGDPDTDFVAAYNTAKA